MKSEKLIVNHEIIHDILRITSKENLTDKIKELKVEIIKLSEKNDFNGFTAIENKDTYELPKFPVEFVDRYDLIELRPINYQLMLNYEYVTVSLFINYYNDAKEEDYYIDNIEIDLIEGNIVNLIK